MLFSSCFHVALAFMPALLFSSLLSPTPLIRVGSWGPRAAHNSTANASPSGRINMLSINRVVPIRTAITA